MVRKGDCHTRRNQDDSVEQWQLPGADGFFGARKVCGVRVDHQWPGELEIRPQHIGYTLVAVAAQPGSGKGAGIEECTEERREEHDLGKNEPAHAHAERTVHLLAVQPLVTFFHHAAEPAKHHVGNGQCTGKEDPLAGSAAGAAAHTVDHAAAAKHGQQQADRSDDRPFALRRYVVGFVTRHLLFSLSGSLYSVSLWR